MRSLVLLRINCRTTVEMPRFTNSKDVVRVQFSKTSQVTLATPIRAKFVIVRLALDNTCMQNLAILVIAVTEI